MHNIVKRKAKLQRYKYKLVGNYSHDMTGGGFPLTKGYTNIQIIRQFFIDYSIIIKKKMRLSLLQS